MAVYTEIDDEELAAFLTQYDVGAPLSCKDIAEGVENSNFLLITQTGSFILTLYEKRVNPQDLPFFLGLLRHLAGHGVSCPVPVAGRDGEALRRLAGRPAAIVTFLHGLWPRRITPQHCGELGTALAHMHVAGVDFPLHRVNSLSLGDWRPLLMASAARADEVLPGLGALLADELSTLERSWPDSLPKGIIHADLFPDNVFFQGDTLTGLIDFYFACTDQLAYDLAICLNAWCFESDGAFNITKARTLIAHYQRVRPCSPEEIEALPLLCRGSALRFLLTRLYDWLNPAAAGALVRPKNPLEYWKKLRFHREVTSPAAYGIDLDNRKPYQPA